MLILAGLIAGFAVSDRMQRWAETAGYEEPVVYAESTPFQRIVLTRSGNDLRLFLNGNLQFSSRDEYRYHEALVHPALGRVAEPRDVRSEEHTSELQSLMRSSYAVFCLKTKNL